MRRRACWMVIFPSADRGGSSQLTEKPKPHFPMIKRASCGIGRGVRIQSRHVKIHTLKVSNWTTGTLISCLSVQPSADSISWYVFKVSLQTIWYLCVQMSMSIELGTLIFSSYNWTLNEGPIILLCFLHVSPLEATRFMPQRLQNQVYLRNGRVTKRLTIMNHG